MATPFRLKRSAVSGKRPGLSDLQRGELALNFYDGYLFAERDTGGVGIGTTIALLTPWTENFGGDSIYYSNSVGVGTATPRAKFDVDGDLRVTGITTALGGVRVPADSNIRATTDDSIVIVGDEGIRNGIQISGTTGIGSTEAYIDASGRFVSHADTGEFYLTGSSDTGGTDYFNATTRGTFVGGSQLDPGASNIFLGLGTTSHFLGNVGIGSTQPTAKLDVNGQTELDDVNISGVTTYSATTNNTLGNADTGAIQIDGGLGINKNVTIGENLYVGGYAEFVGVATFKGGTINLGDANTDDINVSGEFISSLVPNDDATYDLGITTQRWRDGYFSGIVTTTNLHVAGITTTILLDVGIGGTVITTTETGLVGINSTAPTTTLDVGGTINSSTDVTINGTSVITTASNDAVALAIALG